MKKGFESVRCSILPNILFKMLKIKVTSFKKKNDDELNVFAMLLVTNGKDKDFDPFRATLDRLETESVTYNDSLLKAKGRGEVDVNAKNTAKAALLKTISVYANFINGAGIEKPELIVKSGFDYTSTERNRPNPIIYIAAPYGLSVSAKDVSEGELWLSVELVDPNLVVKNMAEVSYDGGKTWTMLLYFSGKKVLLTNLTRRVDLLIRVCSIGTYSRTSDYSTPISAYLS